jgi:predicted Rossmann fold nucleotide-binding protein DprA/Smf involved in DNA uptake
VPQLPDNELCVWQALGSQPLHVNELARGLGRGAGEVSAALILLELKNLARQVGPMLYTRA